MNLRNHTSVKNRRLALAKQLGIALDHIGRFSLDESTASARNCENMIGVAQVPMGVAGPLRLASVGPGQVTDHKHEYYIPLATTEGALVASVSRGCKAITGSGGATVASVRVGATRGPVFAVENLAQSLKLERFFKDEFDQLKAIAAQTSRHLRLTGITSQGAGKFRFARFVFDTQDAMGLNMVTIATDAMASFIRQKTGIPCVALSGNFCVDKKPAWGNFTNGRGISVWAEVTLSKNVLSSVLKTSAQRAYDVWLAKCMVGSAMTGSMGFNGQYANVVAAIFLATGQDIAHVVEGSVGVTTAEVVGEDLYVSVYMPDLMVGTVGGGTALATQQEALTMLGVAGSSPVGQEGKNSQKFAEIVGAAVLAGEISLLASLQEGSLARAHQALARGKT